MKFVVEHQQPTRETRSMMDASKDRPISVYDNLSTPATTSVYMNTPKPKVQMQPTDANGASRYREIAFKFDDNKPKANEQQLLVNGNRSSSRSPAEVHADLPHYATPLKSTTAPTNKQNPLSQHSQSELNEACQSIAAVKAALNDAKSKFFGLNGYAQDNPSTSPTHPNSDGTHKLLPNNHSYQPQVQIIAQDNTSTSHQNPLAVSSSTAAIAKPQPKYQNIPENSAIYRQNRPPERPPKPGERQTNATAATVTTPELEALNTMPSRENSPTNQVQLPTSLATTYKQVPLNDIDTSQPSQAVYMSTTVPQNIKGSKIAGRHTPTRNSLRHSRMLVVNNRNYQGTEYPNPMNFKQPNLARTLLILQIFIGVAICFLSIWLFILAPNTPMQDNPYWSGLALLLAGILGLGLVRFQRIKRHKVRENFFLFVRANSFILSLMAMILCSIALVCASIHFVRITADDTVCESTNKLVEHSSCACTFNYRNDTTDAAKTSDSLDDVKGEQKSQLTQNVDNAMYKVEYRDFSCQEIRCEWTYILGFSVALNAAGLIVSIAYLLLLACYRHNSTKRFYSSVHTSTF